MSNPGATPQSTGIRGVTRGSAISLGRGLLGCPAVGAARPQSETSAAWRRGDASRFQQHGGAARQIPQRGAVIQDNVDGAQGRIGRASAGSRGYGCATSVMVTPGEGRHGWSDGPGTTV